MHPQCSTLGAGDDPETLSRRSVIAHPSAHTAQALEQPNWLVAAHAAASKKGEDIKILDLREVTSFTDYFVICSVANARQGQAISDEIEKRLKEMGELPVSIEGYDTAEWILMDYGDFIVHVFSESARAYYDLERLWRHAKVLEPSVLS